MHLNDFQKLMFTSNSIGCKYSIITAKEMYDEEIHKSSYAGDIEWDAVIELDNGNGYGGFFCHLYFQGGKYQGHGCWE